MYMYDEPDQKEAMPVVLYRCATAFRTDVPVERRIMSTLIVSNGMTMAVIDKADTCDASIMDKIGYSGGRDRFA